MIRVCTLFLLGCSLVAGVHFAYAALAPEEKQMPEHQNRLIRQYVYQQQGNTLTNGDEIHQPFSLTISEDAPNISSAFLEITGIAYDTGGATSSITTSIDDASFTTRAETVRIHATSRGKPFRILYDLSPYLASVINAPGTYTFTYDGRIQDMEVRSLAVAVISTYEFDPIQQNLMPIRATVTSRVFDTGTPIGAGYNALMWRGVYGNTTSNPEGRVRLQFATAECANGAHNAPACTDGGQWTFIGGSTCSATDWFEPQPDTPVDLFGSGCLLNWNDKRFYRYRVMICSLDCDVAGQYTPRVDDVIVNWSP